MSENSTLDDRELERCDLAGAVAAVEAELELLRLLVVLDDGTRALAAMRSLATIRDRTTATVRSLVVEARSGYGRGLAPEQVANAAAMRPDVVAAMWALDAIGDPVDGPAPVST